MIKEIDRAILWRNPLVSRQACLAGMALTFDSASRGTERVG